MKRLNQENINTPELTEKIFKERWREQVHYIDWERFQRLARYFKGGSYLDIGCFNSPMPFELKMKFKSSKIVALDYCPYVIQKMYEKFPEVNYICSNFFDMDFALEDFNYIVAAEIIEHVEFPQAFIKKCMRILKPGGYLAVSVPANEGAHGYNDEHLWSFTREDIDNLFGEYGQIEVEEVSDSFPLFYVWCKKN